MTLRQFWEKHKEVLATKEFFLLIVYGLLIAIMLDVWVFNYDKAKCEQAWPTVNLTNYCYANKMLVKVECVKPADIVQNQFNYTLVSPLPGATPP